MQVVCVFIVGPEPCGLWPGFAVATVRAARDDPSALRAPPHKWGEGSGLRCFSLGSRSALTIQRAERIRIGRNGQRVRRKTTRSCSGTRESGMFQSAMRVRMQRWRSGGSSLSSALMETSSMRPSRTWRVTAMR